MSTRCVRSDLLSFLSDIRRPRPPTLFPYTTLFRSEKAAEEPKKKKRPHRDYCAPKSFFAYESKQEKNRRSEEHTSELQSLRHLVCRLLLEKKKRKHCFIKDKSRESGD